MAHLPQITTSAGHNSSSVRLVDVHPAARCCTPWGFQDPGAYHWVLADPVPFDQPVPGRGRLGLYWLPTDLLPARTER